MRSEEKRSLVSQAVLYGVAGVGLLVALRRVRPFARFVEPSEIPDRFVKSKVLLRGNVVRTEPSHAGPLLMVETIPLVPLPRFGKSRLLPITVANVDVTPHGTSWLQSVANDTKIVFIPVAKNKDNVECRISLVRPNEKNLELGEKLVRLGFGVLRKLDSVANLSKDKQTLTYYESLVAAQKWAQRQRNGHWHYAIQPTLLWKLRNTLSMKARSVLPPFFTRHLNT